MVNYEHISDFLELEVTNNNANMPLNQSLKNPGCILTL